MSGTCGRELHLAILGAAGLAAALCGAAATAASPPLRYDFDLGDRLVYERRVRVMPLDGELVLQRYSQQLQIWCLATDLEEDYLLAELVHVDDQPVEPARGALFHVDHRGRRRFPEEILNRLAELDPLFELLPVFPPALEAGPTWLSEPDHFGRRWRCTRGPARDDGLLRVDFVLEDPTGVAEARGVSQRGAYWFDPRTGTVTRVESEQTDLRAQQRTLAVTRLHDRRRHEPLWCQRRITEADKFLRTLRLEDHLLDQITTEPNRVEQMLARIDRLWLEFVTEMPSRPESPIRRLARAHRRLLAEDTARNRERATLAREWLGATAAHWSLQTPTGETIRSEAARDRHVLECFWSADSLCSLRSFEVLRRLRQAQPPERLRIVCLNLDADVAAARRATQLCGAQLTHVLAGPPFGGQPPGELPVFRLLDRNSRILGVYFGWQPTLAQKIDPLTR
jgi:hypothetical protein